MKTTGLLRALIAAIGMLALYSGPASAERVIPPDNSAVNQYTETFPTTGGDATGDRDPRSPEKVLGGSNADRLESLGPDGRAAAELATKTAPTGEGGKRDSHAGPGQRDARDDDSEGSSALAEIVAQATGSSSSGGTGLLLPLVIVAAIVVSGLYFWRRKGETA